ncbi:cytochrome b5 domain-containing protein 1 [Condylostylus longicornis]|uniref:cytochrome b5 domain-containing protein 1 n=1 Tax=Condylostylus longicornis TaxID=2530218 RepID=UPI00244E2D07|nr:cytochrome b5 domain-containing protein 1 [Condylostylus longicornis]
MPYFDIPKCKFFIRDEVVIHNKPHDFWIIIHGNVLDLTSFIISKLRNNTWNITMNYLLAFGGKDLSKYFHKNLLPKTEISINTGQPRVLFPPITESITGKSHKIWSIDSKYHIGKITIMERSIRIINTLTGKIHCIVVCEEDKIYDIMKKYKKYNSHCGSYIWRKNSKNCSISGRLNLNFTLTENGILPEKHDIKPPSIWLFYSDDLTEG